MPQDTLQAAMEKGAPRRKSWMSPQQRNTLLATFLGRSTFHIMSCGGIMLTSRPARMIRSYKATN
jgi:hypothetical protein